MSIANVPAGTALPTHLDLPHTDGKPVENFYQPYQSYLLTGSFTPWLDRLHPDGNYAIGADSGIYWKLTPLPEDGCKAPDWFYVPNVPKLLDGVMRLSYVLWQEKVSPFVVIEYVSGTGAEERDATPFRGKFWVYERAIKAQYYAIWDPFRVRLDVFVLDGEHYRPVAANERGRFPLGPLGVELGVWEGMYSGHPGDWLRAWDENGNLLPTPEEALAAEQRVSHAERQKAERLAAKLRELGLDPDAV